MAEKQMVGDEVAANRPTPEGVIVRDSAQELIRQAPEPSEEGANTKIYQVMYPNDHFVMEDMPVVSTSGTPLTAEQAEKLLPVAEASGVRIVEVSE